MDERSFTEPSTMDRARLKSMSGQLDSWISRQAILVEVAQENQKATDIYRMSAYDNNYHMCYIHTLMVRSINCALNIVDRIRL